MDQVVLLRVMLELEVIKNLEEKYYLLKVLNVIHLIMEQLKFRHLTLMGLTNMQWMTLLRGMK